jgi:uncharacterized protein (TIGR03435 family)
MPTGGIGTSDPHRISYHGVWLTGLIAASFGVRPDQVTAPDWLGKERYDIVANIPDGATQQQFNVMMGNLLRDRFHLRFHLEPKVLPVYALRVGKNGPKFKESDPERRSDAKASSGGIDAQGYPILPPDFHGMLARPKPGEIFMAAQDETMAMLARQLEDRAGRPVIDETGLTGHYDLKLHTEWMRRPGDTADAPDPAPSVFTAVQEQLGLKLESSTAPFDRLIIDSMDREPTEN